jgi:uncharacterized protein
VNLKEWLRRLPDGVEVALTLLVAFGAIVPRSLAALFEPEGLIARSGPPITNAALLGSVIYELLVLGVLGLFLRARGWTFARLGLRPSWGDSALGVPLALGAYFAYALLWLVIVSAWPRIGQIGAATHLVGAHLRWLNVLLVSAINPVFEEVFVCAYVIAALSERHGATAAINVSAAIRVFCHFYQGVVGVLAIVPMALLFAYWYARTRRLWPLIVAHAILDLAGLAVQMTR